MRIQRATYGSGSDSFGSTATTPAVTNSSTSASAPSDRVDKLMADASSAMEETNVPFEVPVKRAKVFGAKRECRETTNERHQREWRETTDSGH